MLILITGMIRSGSTLQLNILQALLAEAKIPFTSSFIESYEELDEHRKRKREAGSALVLKLHFFDPRLKPLLKEPDVHAFYIWRNTLDMTASLLRRTTGGLAENFEDIKEALRSKYNYLNTAGVVTSKYEDVITSTETELAKIAEKLGLDISPQTIVTLAAKLSQEKQRERLESAEFVKTRVPPGSTWATQGADQEAFIHVDDYSMLHQNHFTSDGAIGRWSETLSPEEASRLAAAETDIAAAKVSKTQSDLDEARASIASLKSDLEKTLAELQRTRSDLREEIDAAIAEREAFRNHIINLHAWREAMRTSRSRKKMLALLPLPKVPEKLTVPTMTVEAIGGRSPKISIITPSFNSAADLDRAIRSVLDQDYDNWEHIVVDGGSTDATRELLASYNHLNWISEPDRGQVHAMNKGFAMASGDVISYLNADDYYLPGAFRHAAEQFADDEILIVYGNVEVYDGANGSWWINRPRYDFKSVLRHWEPDAFCVNPVGYFYRREVQESVPILESDGAKHDLAFLMEVARRYEARSVKLDRSFGAFINRPDTQTGREQSVEKYWSPENFGFIERLLSHLPEESQKVFREAQKAGYEQRKKWLRESQAAARQLMGA